MRLSKPALLVMLAGVVAVLGIIFMRGQRPAAQREGASAPATNVDVVVSSAPTNDVRSHHGKDSLTEKERKIIHKAFEEIHVYGIYERAYRVGMICLKRRLNYWEVRELIEGKIVPRTSLPVEGERVGYYFPFSHSLGLWFDKDGNLQRVKMYGDSRYDFPPLESVTPGTSIEPPPRNHESE